MHLKALADDIRKRIGTVDTIEKKSFWTLCPIIGILGILSLPTTVPTFGGQMFVNAGAFSCILFSILMAIICYRTKNYHVCYPVLCIVVSCLLIPMAFLANGGFNSGMPILCAAGTMVCAFCYEKKWRFIALGLSIAMNSLMFYISANYISTLHPVNPDWVNADIALCYYMASLGVFLCINVVLSEAREYVAGAEVLANSMDARVREMLIRKADRGMLQEKGKLRNATVMFADISGFTSISEILTPEQTAEYLNTFLAVAERCIHENGGIVDKFIGDCVMAYWPDTLSYADSKLSAVRAFMETKYSIARMQDSILRQFSVPLSFSAGIDSGPVIQGGIGSDTRRDFTIIGDTVNTASRIESVAKSGELLVSESVAECIRDYLYLEPTREDYILKGKEEPVELFVVRQYLKKPSKKNTEENS